MRSVLPSLPLLALVAGCTVGPHYAGPPQAAPHAAKSGAFARAGDLPGPFLFGGFGIADAFYAPVVLRFRTYGVPLDATCVGYARRIMECAAVREWIDAALAEKDFVASEEPYRSPPEDTRG